MKVGEIQRDNPDFPHSLLSAKPPVERLLYRGEWRTNIFHKCVAVVGSRKMSRYGRAVIEEVVPRLCAAGYTIVSGLMYGVDHAAHRAALDCGGNTIAVLGYGIERKNDEESDLLAAQIVKQGGLIIAEYPGTTRGQTWTFPQRNRIVVGISSIVVIVEAGEKSGSLNTASWASRMGKEVYVVPGSIFSKTSVGTNTLVASGSGRVLTSQVLDELLGVATKNKDKVFNIKNLNKEEQKVVTHLKLHGPQSVNELSRLSGMSPHKLLALLLGLDMKNVVTAERGIWGLVP